MNKTDLINKLADQLDGDRRSAQIAVEGMIDLIQRAVQSGEGVAISGFGVFEKRARAARTARNPRTGEAVKVKKTVVPSFRPGKYFKDVVAGVVKLPKATGAPLTARAAAAAAKAAAEKAAQRSSTGRSARSAVAAPTDITDAGTVAADSASPVGIDASAAPVTKGKAKSPSKLVDGKSKSDHKPAKKAGKK